MKFVIVGGVAGGASAAARARRLSEQAEIVLFERGPDVSFANCGLPYYIGGVIADRAKLLVSTAAKLAERFHLDVRTRSEVIVIDRLRRTVRVRNLSTNQEYDETYDRLLLAPGAAPIKPGFPGVDLPGVFTLRNLQDTDAIFAAVNAKPKRALLLGGGFIGLELAENFVHRGIPTTLAERNAQILTPFDIEMTTPVLQTLREKGVEVLLSENATGIERLDDCLVVKFASGRAVETDLVILGVGVRPENKLAVDAGLSAGPRGGIQVDEYLRTSDPHIYAVGDAIEVTDATLGLPTQIPLAGPANRQGRIAAENALFPERQVRYRGTQGTAILGVFDRVAAMTGASEKTLLRAERPFRKAYIHPANHAGYYPGAEGMSLKILFEPTTGKLLGAQAVGGAGVDKRIDVLAVALHAGFTVFDLEEMELCYAPQFGSAKDPVNMAGFVAAGLVRGDHPQTDVESILDPDGPFRYLLDVRTREEFAKGHIPRAVNIPVDELRGRLAELPKNEPMAVYCQVGQRGYIATRILIQSGFDARNIGGGYRTYLLHQG